jgi:hypothetical protein
VEHGVPTVVRAWELHRERHHVERCLNRELDEERQRRENPPHQK